VFSVEIPSPQPPCVCHASVFMALTRGHYRAEFVDICRHSELAQGVDVLATEANEMRRRVRFWHDFVSYPHGLRPRDNEAVAELIGANV
jgi:hypothetical protein